MKVKNIRSIGLSLVLKHVWSMKPSGLIVAIMPVVRYWYVIGRLLGIGMSLVGC